MARKRQIEKGYIQSDSTGEEDGPGAESGVNGCPVFTCTVAVRPSFLVLEFLFTARFTAASVVQAMCSERGEGVGEREVAQKRVASLKAACTNAVWSDDNDWAGR